MPTRRVNIRDEMIRNNQQQTRISETHGVTPKTIQLQGGAPDAAVDRAANAIIVLLQSRYPELLAEKSNFMSDSKKLSEIQQTIVRESGRIPGLTSVQSQKAAEYVIAEVLGLGKDLDPLMRDSSITEVMVVGTPNGPNVWVENEGKLEQMPMRLREEDMARLANRIVEDAGRKINAQMPYADIQLPDGSRVHVDRPPITHGTTITIRKSPQRVRPIDEAYMVRSGMVTQEILDFMAFTVRSKLNILVIGATGSGKTTISRYLIQSVPHHERIGTLEDTFELNPNHPHIVAQQAVLRDKDPIRIKDLFKNTLRQRLDRIIVGEVRVEEGASLLEAWRSGHPGGITTLHAGDAIDAVDRLTDMLIAGGVNVGTERVVRQIHRTLDLIIYIKHYAQDGSRKVTRIVEVLPIEEAEGENSFRAFRDIFVFRYRGRDPQTGKVLGDHKYTQHLSVSKRLKIMEAGEDIPEHFGGTPSDDEINALYRKEG